MDIGTWPYSAEASNTLYDFRKVIQSKGCGLYHSKPRLGHLIGKRRGKLKIIRVALNMINFISDQHTKSSTFCGDRKCSTSMHIGSDKEALIHGSALAKSAKCNLIGNAQL